MNRGNQVVERHPIEPEELMAYLDGELPLERAAEAAAHLERCRDCQAVAGDLQGVSRRLMVWQVESGKDADIPQRVAVALEERGQKKTSEPQWTWREWLRKPRKPVWVGGVAFATVVVGLFVTSIVTRFSERASEPNKQMSGPVRQMVPVLEKTRGGLDEQVGPRGENFGATYYSAPPSSTTIKNPMIVRTGTLSLTTKEFDKARAGLDEILKRHRGYLGQLSAVAPPGKGWTLTATLRVPADQLDAAIAELEKLGRIESESQNGEEVTQRYVDLEARIANARNTELRLTDILRERSGKLSDVLTVENEIDRVRGEIERMEAERKTLAHQVDFATLSLTLTEQYEQQLQAVPVSTSTRLRNAAVEGYASMVDGLVGVMLFLFSYGPSLLLWGAVLFFPIRAVWKKWRARAA